MRQLLTARERAFTRALNALGLVTAEDAAAWFDKNPNISRASCTLSLQAIASICEVFGLNGHEDYAYEEIVRRINESPAMRRLKAKYGATLVLNWRTGPYGGIRYSFAGDYDPAVNPLHIMRSIRKNQ